MHKLLFYMKYLIYVLLQIVWEDVRFHFIVFDPKVSPHQEYNIRILFSILLEC